MVERWVPNPLVARLRRGGVPRDLRLMAAQGLLPLKPEDLLELWIDLVSDADEAVRVAAGESLKAFPAAELLPIVKNRETPVSVLNWVVSSRAEPELREAALQNHSLPDATIEQLAPTLPPVLAELVVMNQARLLRRTSLLVALEGNAGLSNDQKRRLHELREAFKTGAQPEAPPAARAPATPAPPPEPEPAPGRETYMTEDEAIVRYLSEEERKQTEKVSAVKKIYRLNVAEKLMLALKGTREERSILIRDPNRLVATAVISSPRITEAEIESISAMTNVSWDILRQIGHHREWMKRYTVINNLVRNRRTPVNCKVREPVPGFPPEELDLLVGLGGLFVKVNRSFGALGGRLTREQREGIEATLDRARTALREGVRSELQVSMEEMQKAFCLLEEWSGASQIASKTRRAAAPEMRPARSKATATPATKPTLGARRASPESWTVEAEELYRALARVRLAEVTCHACGTSLESAILIRTYTRVGPELNEYGLSERGAARFLAATDDLVVECGHCGAKDVVKAPRPAGS